MKYLVIAISFLFLPGKLWGIVDITGVVHNSLPWSSSCTQGNGSIDLTAQGNAGPFTYNWSNGQTTEDIDHLCAGTFTVTVTNIFGCTRVLIGNVYDCNQFVPPLVITNPIITPISAVGASDGAIDISASGGFGNLYYKWTNQANGQVVATTQDVSNLPAGVYCVLVTGGCNQGVSACFTIVACSTIYWGVNSEVKNACDCTGCWFCDAPCRGGSITPNITSPIGPKKYIWSTGETSASIKNLLAGSYAVTLTDVNTSCTTTRTFSIVTKPVVVEKVSGCAWKALCDGEQIKFHQAEAIRVYSIQNYQGEQRCISQQYCDGIPVEGTLIPEGYPEKRIDWERCKGQLVCDAGLYDEVFLTIFGTEEILEEGANCQDIVKCTITWPDGTTASKTSTAGQPNWTYCHEIITGGLDPACNSYCVIYKYCEDIGVSSFQQVGQYCYNIQYPAAEECLEYEYCPPHFASPVDDRDSGFDDKDNIYFQISPNPFKDHIFINYGNIQKGTILDVNIFDAIGNQILTEDRVIDMSSGTIAIYIDRQIPSGAYTVLVQGKEAGVSYRATLVKVD